MGTRTLYVQCYSQTRTLDNFLGTDGYATLFCLFLVFFCLVLCVFDLFIFSLDKKNLKNKSVDRVNQRTMIHGMGRRKRIFCILVFYKHNYFVKKKKVMLIKIIGL